VTQAPDQKHGGVIRSYSGQAEFREYRAMVTARHVVDRGGQHGAPGIDEDVIDREER
jgi:hypothetical protein